jgi:hypothetical protein
MEHRFGSLEHAMRFFVTRVAPLQHGEVRRSIIWPAAER